MRVKNFIVQGSLAPILADGRLDELTGTDFTRV